ncbi:DUF6233 domain-containing protein [Streptomyces sp. NPDC032472]|uniref:DUF6233 domain-containing protein n=1 Tax=Streptomyces sp. NPDC032472 TaxID=3155018 RepID=UPI0033E45FF5
MASRPRFKRCGKQRPESRADGRSWNRCGGGSSTASAVQRQPTRVHTSDCRRGARSRSATRDMAVEVLRAVPSVIACPLCRPYRELGLPDL